MQLQRYTPHYRQLLKLGLPIMIGQLGMIILGFADTMMVGQHSTAELGAAGFVNNLFNLVIVFSTGFSYGLTPVVGGLFGQHQHGQIGEKLKNALLVNGITALLLTLIMWLLYSNIHRLGQPEELLPLIRPYYLILLASLIFVLLFNAFRQFSEGITDTLTPMYILLFGNMFNIFGNWVLIYGKLGFPEMGLMGAGLSTLLSRVLMLVVFVILFLSARRYKIYREGFRNGTCNRADQQLLTRIGLPVGLQMGMETASFSLSAILVGWLGTIALAAHQVMITIGQLGFMLYYGMAAAVAVRASNFHGRGDLLGARTTASAGFHLICAMALAVSALVLVFRNRICLLFSDSPEVAMTVARLIIPFVIYQFGDGLQCTYSNALRGIHDVKMVTLYAFIAYFLISLPSAYLFAFVLDWGLIGIWFSFPLGLTSAGILFWLRFRRNFVHLQL